MSHTPKNETRRTVLKIAAASTLSGVLGAWGARRAVAKATHRSLKVAWLPGAVCVAPLPLAKEKGIFAKYNLDVELVPWPMHSPEFLASPTNGQSDAAVTMIHNWLVPIQNGLDVRILTAVQGGCVRVMGSRAAGVTDVAALKGKTLAVGGPPALAKMVFSIILINNGIDPDKDVSWVQVKDEDLAAAFKTGKVQAVGTLDPPGLVLEQTFPDLVEVASNQSGSMKGRSCCVLAAGQGLWKERPLEAASLVMALNEASDYAQAHPDEAAAMFAKSSQFKPDDILKTEKSLAYHTHQRNADIRSDIVLYATDLKRIGVFPADLDVQVYADKAYAQVKC
jgi:NitT/TauT family transport system substrate-binding protein